MEKFVKNEKYDEKFINIFDDNIKKSEKYKNNLIVYITNKAINDLYKKILIC